MRPALPLAFALASTLPSIAYAQDGDGAYGRLDASISVVLGAGAAYSWDADAFGAVVDARVRVFESGGLFATLHTELPDAPRVFTGIELRPFFPALFLQSMSTGRAHLDLFLQSFGVELGADVGLARDGVLAFGWGLSLEVPLVTPERFAHGMGLRLGFRRARALADARPNTGLVEDLETDSVYALLAIGLDAGGTVANWEPARHRDR